MPHEDVNIQNSHLISCEVLLLTCTDLKVSATKYEILTTSQSLAVVLCPFAGFVVRRRQFHLSGFTHVQLYYILYATVP